MSTTQQQQYSIVYDTGYDVSKDGYTKTPKAFHANGLWVIDLTCSHYQGLVDRNWRRSGKYLYKPHPDRCLSLQYTIRLDVHRFTPSQSHKNLIQRIGAYLRDGVMPPATGNYENVDNNVESDENGGDGGQQQQNKTKKQKQKKQKKSKKIVSPTFLSTLQRQVAAEIFSIVKNQFSVSDEILSNVDQVHVQMPLQQQQQQHKKMKTGDLFCSVAMQIFGQLKKLGQS